MKDLDKDRNRENITRAEFFRIIMVDYWSWISLCQVVNTK